jgi:hypothetical protein
MNYLSAFKNILVRDVFMGDETFFTVKNQRWYKGLRNKIKDAYIHRCADTGIPLINPPNSFTRAQLVQMLATLLRNGVPLSEDEELSLKPGAFKTANIGADRSVENTISIHGRWSNYTGTRSSSGSNHHSNRWPSSSWSGRSRSNGRVSRSEHLSLPGYVSRYQIKEHSTQIWEAKGNAKGKPRLAPVGDTISASDKAIRLEKEAWLEYREVEPDYGPFQDIPLEDEQQDDEQIEIDEQMNDQIAQQEEPEDEMMDET